MGNMASPKQARYRLTVAQRRSVALAMRIDGRTYDQIASELGYANRSGAFKAVNDALRDVPREKAEEYRALQIERLERVLRTQFARLDEGGDPAAATAVLRVLEALDRYTGFDQGDAAASRAGTLLDVLIANSRAALERPQAD